MARSAPASGSGTKEEAGRFDVLGVLNGQLLAALHSHDLCKMLATLLLPGPSGRRQGPKPSKNWRWQKRSVDSFWISAMGCEQLIYFFCFCVVSRLRGARTTPGRSCSRGAAVAESVQTSKAKPCCIQTLRANRRQTEAAVPCRRNLVSCTGGGPRAREVCCVGGGLRQPLPWQISGASMRSLARPEPSVSAEAGEDATAGSPAARRQFFPVKWTMQMLCEPHGLTGMAPACSAVEEQPADQSLAGILVTPPGD